MTDAETKNDALVRRHSASLTLTPGEASEQKILSWLDKEEARQTRRKCTEVSENERVRNHRFRWPEIDHHDQPK